MDADSDDDGMKDGYEYRYGLDPWVDDSANDPDKDYLNNTKEYQEGTKPLVWDSDRDGLSDYREVTVEYGSHGKTDPMDSDSDDDLMPDGWEVRYWDTLNPKYGNDDTNDSDSDTLTNLEEYRLGTNPLKGDTDADGMPDEWETDNNLNPNNASDAILDADSDGLINIQEYRIGTDPGDSDTDDDSVGDWRETQGTSITSSQDPEDYHYKYGAFLENGLMVVQASDIVEYKYTPSTDGFYRISVLLKGNNQNIPIDVRFPDVTYEEEAPYKLWNYIKTDFIYIDSSSNDYLHITIENEGTGNDEILIGSVLFEKDNPFVYNLIEPELETTGVPYDNSNGAVNVTLVDGLDTLDFNFNIYEYGYYRVVPRVTESTLYNDLILSGISGEGSEIEIEINMDYYTDVGESGEWRYGSRTADNSNRRYVPGVYSYLEPGEYKITLSYSYYKDFVDHIYIYAYQLDPFNDDTDFDGLTDNTELTTVRDTATGAIKKYTSPFMADTDGDGIEDNDELTTDLDDEETGIQNTNPVRWDTDGDFLSDSIEINGWTVYTFKQDFSELYSPKHVTSDPFDKDADSDKLLDGDEKIWGSDPNDSDTDDDGLPDGSLDVELADDNPIVIENQLPIIGDPVPLFHWNPSTNNIKLEVWVYVSDNSGVDKVQYEVDGYGSMLLTEGALEGNFYGTLDLGWVDLSDLWEVTYTIQAWDDNDNYNSGGEYKAGFKKDCKDTVATVIKVVADALAFINWRFAATITGFLIGAGKSIVDNIMMFKDLPKIVAGLGGIKDAFGSMFSDPSLLTNMLGDMWEGILDKAKKYNPLEKPEDEKGDWRNFNDLFAIFHTIGFVIMEMVDPVFGGIAAILSHAATLASGVLKMVGALKAVALKAGSALNPVTDIMRLAGQSMKSIGVSAAGRIADAVSTLRYMASSGAGNIAAIWAKTVGKKVDEAAVAGRAMRQATKWSDDAFTTLIKVHPAEGALLTAAKRDELLKSLDAVALAGFQVGKISDDAMLHVAKIIGKEGTQIGDDAIEALLKVTTKYGDDITTGPMKHIDEMCEATGMDKLVKTMGDNPKVMDDYVGQLEYASGKWDPNLKNIEFEKGLSGNNKNIDIFDSADGPNGKYIEYKTRNVDSDWADISGRIDDMQTQYMGSGLSEGTRTGVIDCRNVNIDISRGDLLDELDIYWEAADDIDEITVLTPAGYGDDIIYPI